MLDSLIDVDFDALYVLLRLYPKLLNLTMHTQCVITDSGGLQEETTVMGVPCLTLRNNTERPVTIKHGTNQLVKQEKKIILNAFNNAINRKGEFETPKFWDGKTAERIVKDLISWLS